MESGNIESGETSSSYKIIQIWSDVETSLLLDLYVKYIFEIGAMKKFRNKKDMWAKIASKFANKTAKQCEQRYKTVLKAKNPIVNNGTTGLKRNRIDLVDKLTNIDFFDESTGGKSTDDESTEEDQKRNQNCIAIARSGCESAEIGDETLPYKTIHVWSDGDTRLLLELHAKYITEIGTLKTFKNKKEMWAKIATELSDKTAKQCEERYKTVLKRKNNQHTTVLKRKQIVDELNDNSIEQEAKLNSRKRIEIEKSGSEYFESDAIDKESSLSYKRIQVWSDGDTKLLLDLYDNYISEVGPMKQFKNKKEMWAKIATEFSEKTAKQCEERYKTVFKRKMSNNTTGAKRKQIDFDYDLAGTYITNYSSSEDETQISNQMNFKIENEESDSIDSESIKSSETGKDPLLFQFKNIWSAGDTRQLLELHKIYMPEIGLKKKFKNKKHMWHKIASKISDKTAKQCEERYKTLLKRKKSKLSPADNYNTAASKETQMDFEDKLTKIFTLDDSIKPEAEISCQNCIQIEKKGNDKGNAEYTKNKTVQEALLELAERQEEASERRHKEIMDAMSKMQSLLQTILEEKYK